MKIGFLGAGAMGGAILSGAINAGVLDPKQVYVSDMSDQIKEKYAALGCNIVKDNEELGRAADIAVLAVKPQYAAPARRFRQHHGRQGSDLHHGRRYR